MDILRVLGYTQCLKALDENKIIYKNRQAKELTDLKALAYLKRVLSNSFEGVKVVYLKDNRLSFVFRHYYDFGFLEFYKRTGGKLAVAYSANLPFDTKAIRLLKKAHKEIEKDYAAYKLSLVVDANSAPVITEVPTGTEIEALTEEAAAPAVDSLQSQYEEIRRRRCNTQQ